MSNRKIFFCSITIISIVICCFFVLTTKNDTEEANISRNQIVKKIKKNQSEIVSLEKSLGMEINEGIKVYSQAESQALFSKYQILQQQLDLLKYGKTTPLKDEFKGYSIVEAQDDYIGFEPYQVKLILDGLFEEFSKEKLKDYRIFLMSYGSPGVSGIGGAGYSVIFASPALIEPDLDNLKVTLLHEIGHHIHLTYMPETTKEGRKLWKQYHQVRGGTWEGSGKANTDEWSKSSEETFAEDFRLLFGKDQPFFDDIVLGDPRDNPKLTSNLKDFILDIMRKDQIVSNHSPWLQQGVAIRIMQSKFIIIMWIIVVMMILINLTIKDKFKEVIGKDTVIEGIDFRKNISHFH